MFKIFILQSKTGTFYHGLVALLFFLIANTTDAQTITVGNVGSPAALTFPSILGNKVVLAGDGNTFHTGIGIQAGLLQFYTAGTTGSIVFRDLKSGSFGSFNTTEIMRFAGPGNTGIKTSDPQARLDVKGHVLLRGKNAFETAGIWLSNSNVSADPFFVGMRDDNSIGFYWNISNFRWGLWTNLSTGALGINNGYGESGTILTSGGELGATNWQSYSDLDFYKLSTEAQESSSYTLTDAIPIVNLTGLNVTQTYSKPTKMEILVNVQASSIACAFCGPSDVQINVMVNGNVWKSFRHYINNATTNTLNGMAYIDLLAGTHTIGVQVQKLAGPSLQMTAESGRKSSMVLLAAPTQ